MVGFGIRRVGVEASFHHKGMQHAVLGILDVAAKLVLVLGPKLEMAKERKVQDLSDDARDPIISTGDSEGRGQVPACTAA